MQPRGRGSLKTSEDCNRIDKADLDFASLNYKVIFRKTRYSLKPL